MSKKRLVAAIMMTTLMTACTIYYWLNTHDLLLVIFIFLPLTIIAAVIPIIALKPDEVVDNTYFKMTHYPEYFWYPGNVYYKKRAKN